MSSAFTMSYRKPGATSKSTDRLKYSEVPLHGGVPLDLLLSLQRSAQTPEKPQHTHSSLGSTESPQISDPAATVPRR